MKNKSSHNVGRRKCSYPKCRKFRLNEYEFCKDHLVIDAGHPIDHVVRATELECLRFCRTDTELQNALKSMRIIELEIQA